MNEKILMKILEKVEEQNSKIDSLISENEQLRKELAEVKDEVKETKENAQETKDETKKFYKALAEEVVMTLADFIKKALDKNDEKLMGEIDEKLKGIAGLIDNGEKFEKLKEYIHSELSEAGKELVAVLSGNQANISDNLIQHHKDVLNRLNKMEYEIKTEIKTIRDPLYRNRLPDGTVSIGLPVR